MTILKVKQFYAYTLKKSSWILDQQQQHKYDRGTSKEYSATQYNKAIGFQVSGKKIFYENFSQQKHIFGPDSHTEFPICTKITMLVEAHELKLPTK